MLPRRVEDLDILIVTRQSNDRQDYECIVSRHRVLITLEYKLRNDDFFFFRHASIATIDLVRHVDMDSRIGFKTNGAW